MRLRVCIFYALLAYTTIAHITVLALLWLIPPRDTMHVSLANNEHYQILPFISSDAAQSIESHAFYPAFLNNIFKADTTITLLFLLISFTICLIISYWLSQHLAKPISLLYRATQRIEKQREPFFPNSVHRNKEASLIASQLTYLRQNNRKLEEKQIYYSKKDALTGLENLQTAIDTINMHIESNNAFDIIRLSFDDLRAINANLGHQEGDKALKEISKRLHNLATQHRRPFRINSNEFIIISLKKKEDNAWIPLMIDTLSLPIVLQKEATITLQFSLGIVSHPKDGNNDELLLRRTDIALHEAVRKKTAYEYYNDEVEQKNIRRMRIINDLSSCTVNNQVWMDYQPKVNLADGNVTHFEALMRWRHPTLGLLPPDEFITLAEQMGTIGFLSQWMLSHVCQQLHIWNQKGHAFSVAVNLSSSDITNPELPQKISSLLSTYELSPQQLSLEITESAAMHDIEKAKDILESISSLGINLAIDDFGTGFSSLYQLKKLPVNELKIDKSFIFTLCHDKSNHTIVNSTITLGHDLGLNVIAEGVEDVETARILNGLNCDFLQGYWISKPMPAHLVPAWVANFKRINFDQ